MQNNNTVIFKKGILYSLKKELAMMPAKELELKRQWESVYNQLRELGVDMETLIDINARAIEDGRSAHVFSF